MKKYILILFFWALAITSNAQTLKSIGLKIGRSNATQDRYYKSINIITHENYRPGFYAAINLDLFSGKYLSLTTDLSYCQKGYSRLMQHTTYDRPEGDGTFIEIGARQNYISFSPLLKIRKENKHFIPYAIVGPRIDYQVKYDEYFIANNPFEFKKIIFGLTGGFGLDYKFKKYSIGLEYQLQYDLTKFLDTPTTYNNTGLSIKNLAMIMSGSFKYYLNN